MAPLHNQPGAAGSEAFKALVAGSIETGASCALAAVPGGAAESKGGMVRVGRWMSPKEFETMSADGRVVEGAGGRTYVVRPPNPDAYKGAAPGSVYAEFNVPSSALHSAAQPEWAVIPGPNVDTRIYGPPPTEMPIATCIELVCRN
jgi:hypothetical protein